MKSRERLCVSLSLSVSLCLSRSLSHTLGRCTFPGELSKTFSWEGIGCNEALSQIDIKGVGRDIFWPPEVPTRDYTVESSCSAQLVSLSVCLSVCLSVSLSLCLSVSLSPATHVTVI